MYQSDSVWLLLPGAAFWSNCMRIRTGCSATMPSPCTQSTAFCKSSVTLLTAGHHIYSVRQTVWYHGHKLAQIVYEAIAEGGRKWVLRVRQSGESLRESVFTGVLASPPNRNSFHVSSSLPACPYTTSMEGGWITSWCHFLNFHLQSHWGTTWFQMWWALTCTAYSARTVHMFTYAMSTGLKD